MSFLGGQKEDRDPLRKKRGEPRRYGSDKADKGNPKPEAQVVQDFHTNSDVDVTKESQHHSLGALPTQAAAGDHTHNGADSPRLLDAVSITGSRGGNTALASIISALVKLGAVDNTSA